MVQLTTTTAAVAAAAILAVPTIAGPIQYVSLFFLSPFPLAPSF